MTTEERLAALEAKLQELTDRKAICDCIKRNSRGNDRLDADLTAGSYHDDSLHEVGRDRVPGPGYGAHANAAGAWRIVLRRSTVEIPLEGKAALPTGALLPGSGYLRGTRDRTDPSYERPLTADSGDRW
jgi:hypothetical protein